MKAKAKRWRLIGKASIVAYFNYQVGRGIVLISTESIQTRGARAQASVFSWPQKTHSLAYVGFVLADSEVRKPANPALLISAERTSFSFSIQPYSVALNATYFRPRRPRRSQSYHPPVCIGFWPCEFEHRRTGTSSCLVFGSTRYPYSFRWLANHCSKTESTFAAAELRSNPRSNRPSQLRRPDSALT